MPSARPPAAFRRQRLAEDPGVVEHGTLNAYKNYGCRCDRCRFYHQCWWIENRSPNTAIDRARRRAAMALA